MFGKSAAVIDARRDIKRQVVEVMIQCAEAAPIATTGNGILNADQTFQIGQIVGINFLLRLTPADIDTLKTAKGCSTQPQGLEDRSCANLYAHIRKPQLRAADAGCMAAFVHDGVLWAKQVAAMNPHSAIDWPACERRIQNARQQMNLSERQYFLNPGIRLPQTADQVLYWLAYKAGEFAETPNPGQRLVAAFALLHADFRNNPNLSALANNHARAYALFNKWYFEGDFPDQFK